MCLLSDCLLKLYAEVGIVNDDDKEFDSDVEAAILIAAFKKKYSNAL